MTATLIPNGKQAYVDSSGAPLSGGKLYTYAAGTSTPLATYSDAGGTIPNANPVILDARGEALIFWNGSYKITLKTALDVLVWTVNGVVASPVDSSLRADLAASGGAGLIGTTEGNTVQEFIDNFFVTTEINFFPVPTPGAFSVTAGASGNLNGNYDYAVVDVTADGGRSNPSPRIGPTTITSQKGELTGIPVSADSRVVAREIYRTTGSPSDVVKLFYVATIANNTATTYSDNLADGGLGAAIGWANTTAGVFTSNNVKVGNLLGNSVALGESTGNGYSCTALGALALTANTSGLRNTGVGVYAFTSNTTGDQNTGIGVHAGNSNTTGSNNTKLGYGAGFSCITGSDNTIVGNQAAISVAGSASGWSLVGSQSFLQNIQTTGQNTAVGALTGWNNITGHDNVFLGAYAGFYNAISNTLIIDNQQRASEADEIGKCLIYGRFDAAIANQFVKVNGILKSANCQGTSAALPGTASAGGAMNTDGSIYYSTGASAGSTNASTYYNNGAQCGSITVAAGATTYNTTSDYRSKDDLGPVSREEIGDFIDALRPFMGQMKGTTVSRPMLMAHEVAEAGGGYGVTGEKDAVKIEDGVEVPDFQQVDWSVYVPAILAELQFIRGRLARQEAR